MFTVREVETVLGLSAGRLRTYLRAGFVAPVRGEDGELRFSFQDLVLLRKAEGLVTERIPARRVHDALRKLRERLPRNTPLSGVNLQAEGGQVVVDDGRGRWHPESGQMLLHFRRPEPEAGGSVTPLVQARAAAAEDAAAGDDADGSTPNAQELYEKACAVEESDAAKAQDLYRKALARDPRFADAHVNLGRMLHEAGEVHAALVHYRAALEARPQDATAAFNVGVALEDLGQLADAIDAYQKSITCDPANADAHYNVARLLEQQGRPEVAIRHLMIYRQLTRRK